MPRIGESSENPDDRGRTPRHTGRGRNFLPRSGLLEWALCNLPFARKLAAIDDSPFETFVYMRWDLQQLQNAFLDCGQGTDRAVAYPLHLHHLQVQSSEGGQQQLRTGSARAAS